MLNHLFSLQPNSWSQSRLGQVHPDLKQLLADQQEASVLIIFREQADAAAAFAQGISAARRTAGIQNGQAPSAWSLRLAGRSEVLNALRTQSARTQAEVSSLMQALTAAGELRQCRPFYVINAMAACATRAAVDALAQHPAVAQIVPDRTVMLDPIRPIGMAEGPEAQAIEWNLEQIGAPSVWQLGYNGTGVVIGCIDTGVEYGHPALERKFRGYNPDDPAAPQVPGNWFDAVNQNQTIPYDDNRHGTHVTGTMLGATADGTRQIGVAPGARWIAVKAFNSAGQAQASWLIQAGEWMLAPLDQAGNPHPEWAPDVISNSWGGGAGLDEWYRPMVNNWRAAGIVPVFAAGNSGPGGSTIGVPGNYPEAFTVGAVDNQNHLATFSSRGPSPYDELKPEVVAPGVSIRSAIPGGGYGILSGTSMATPHVAGAVALLLSADPDLTIEEIESLLIETSVPLTDSQFPESPNNGYGHGQIDTFAAVSDALAGRGRITGRVTVPGDDTGSPTVSHTPVTSAYAGLPIPMVADATDEIGVARVELRIQTPGAEEETVVQMARTQGDHRSGRYAGTIPRHLVTTAGLSYTIRAADAGGNHGESGPHTVAVHPGLTVGYAEDFETQPDGYVTGGVNNPWEWGVPTYPAAHSGRSLYGTNIRGTGYQPQTNAYLIMPPIDLTSTPRVQLRFWQWYETQAYLDFADIHLSTDGGENWNRVVRQSGSSGGWQRSYLDLSPYAGSTVLVMFNLLSDRLVSARGWFLDDLALIGPTGQAPTAPTEPRATPTAMGSIHLTWSPPVTGEVIRYRVLRASTPGGTPVEVGQTTTLSFYDNGAPQGVPSYYRVVAEDVWGEQGPPSTEVQATPLSVQVIFFDDMEGGAAGWTTNPDRNQWEWGEPGDPPGHAFSGTRLWATRLTRAYDNGVISWLASPPINLAGHQSAALQFAHWHHTEFSYDLCDVEISTDNGTHWTRLARYSGLSGGWQQPIFDLTSYVGQTVTLRFRFTSNQFNAYPGWFIDDVRVAAAAVQQTTLEPPAHPAPPPGYEETRPVLAPVASHGPSPIQSLPAQARVSVRETGRGTETDPATGQYAFLHGVGTWTLVAEAYGYRTAEQMITLARDETVTVDFALEPLGRGAVEGQITHRQTGAPLDEATVTVLEDDQVAPVQTDAEGRFRLELLVGSYTLQVRKPHYLIRSHPVTVAPGETLPVDLSLVPFIAGTQQELRHDDGTREDGFAWNEGGNGWAVRFTPADLAGVLLERARILLMDSWPTPGGDQFAIAVHDSDGPDGAPGTLLLGPQQVTGRRDGQWTDIDLSPLGAVLQRDFYVTYLQVGPYPNVPGLATDKNSPFAERSWQLLAGFWQPSPSTEGNRMIRAVVRLPAGAPVILAPESGTQTNQTAITVSGEAPEGSQVAILRESVELGRTGAGDGQFSLSVSLIPGEQHLTARVVAEHGQGPASEPVTIYLDQEPPALDVTSPADQTRTGRETIDVTGQVTDNLAVDQLRINGRPAPFDGVGRFSERVVLNEGENLIEIAATDRAGNEAAVTRTVIASWTAPPPPVITAPEPGLMTNQPMLAVEGVAPQAEQVRIIRNGENAAEVEVNQGSFAASIILEPGENRLIAVGITSGQPSEPSAEVVVYLDQVPPRLTVATPPADGLMTTREVVEVTGQATDDQGPAEVRVNGQPARMEPGGHFTHRLPLSPGPNQVEVTATDRAGNESRVIRTMRADLPPLTLTNLAPCGDTTLRPGDRLTLTCQGEPGSHVEYLLLPFISERGGPWNGPLAEESPGRYRASLAITPEMRFAFAQVIYYLLTPDDRLGLGVAPGRLTVE